MPVTWFNKVDPGFYGESGDFSISVFRRDNLILILHSSYTVVISIILIVFIIVSRIFIPRISSNTILYGTYTVMIRNMPSIKINYKEELTDLIVSIMGDKSSIVGVQINYNLKNLKIDENDIVDKNLDSKKNEKVDENSEKINENSETNENIDEISEKINEIKMDETTENNEIKFKRYDIKINYEKGDETEFRTTVYGFITFQTKSIASEFMKKFKKYVKNNQKNKLDLNYLNHPKRWTIEYAPEPDDIIWDNITISKFERAIRVILTTFLLLIFIFFSQGILKIE
jgi:hypothetical protein